MVPCEGCNYGSLRRGLKDGGWGFVTTISRDCGQENTDQLTSRIPLLRGGYQHCAALMTPPTWRGIAILDIWRLVSLGTLSRLWDVRRAAAPTDQWGMWDLTDQGWWTVAEATVHDLIYVPSYVLLFFWYPMPAPYPRKDKYAVFAVNCQWRVFPVVPSQSEIFTLCWFNAGPPSQTVAQHWTNIGWISRVSSASMGGIHSPPPPPSYRSAWGSRLK